MQPWASHVIPRSFSFLFYKIRKSIKIFLKNGEIIVPLLGLQYCLNELIFTILSLITNKNKINEWVPIKHTEKDEAHIQWACSPLATKSLRVARNEASPDCRRGGSSHFLPSSAGCYSSPNSGVRSFFIAVSIVPRSVWHVVGVW